MAKDKFKQVQKLIKAQEKARKTYEKNTNKVAKEILKNNDKKDNNSSGC